MGVVGVPGLGKFGLMDNRVSANRMFVLQERDYCLPRFGDVGVIGVVGKQRVAYQDSVLLGDSRKA